MSGKGDDRRPRKVDETTFASNWDRIFSSGVPERTKGAGSNPVSDLNVANVGSNPTTATTYRPPHGCAASAFGMRCSYCNPDPVYLNADTGE